MHIRMRMPRCLVVLALPCWLVAGPLSATIQGVAACRHHAAVHQGMRHSGAPAPRDAPIPPTAPPAPCWCDDMTGGSATVAAMAPALVPGPAVVVAFTSPVVRAPVARATQFPASPSFAPTPPPPNGRAA